MALSVHRQTASAGGLDVESVTVGLDAAIQAAAEMAGSKAIHALAGALYREALDIMADSKEEVPVDLGALRSSGHVKEPVVDSTMVRVELGYGGAAIPYALEQHENLGLRHDDGKAKYLSDPLYAHANGLDDRLAADIRRQVGA